MQEVMSNDENIQILTQAEWLELMAEKTVARQDILSLIPLEAQARLNKIIDPNLLEPDFEWHLQFNALSLTNDEIED